MLFAPIQMPLSPGESFRKGFNYDTNLMKQILERNQLKQKAEQEKANQEQLERHFQANFGLSKAAAGRAAQSAADAHKEAQFRIQALERANDPQKMLEYINSWNGIIPQVTQGQGGNQGLMGNAGGTTPGTSPGVAPPASGQANPVDTNNPTLTIGNQQIPLQTAQMLAGLGAPIPGLKDTLKNYYEGQKTLATETSKARVKRQGELGDKLSEVQSGLEQIAHIKQLIENYKKEAKDIGYSTRFGGGAELRTEPNMLSRLAGRAIQRASHPLEAITHPMDMFEALGVQPGAKIHDKYLSEIRGQLNQLVNKSAKELNTKFTQSEYNTLQKNKAGINDPEHILLSKLKTAEHAFKSAAVKLQGQNALLPSNQPGQEPFALEKALPSEKIGQALAGQYQPVKERPFVDPKNPAYEYFKQNGKYYRRKRSAS